MEKTAAEFATRYLTMRPDELLRTALSYDNLLPAAQTCLREEFARRGMEAPLVDAPRAEFRKLVTVRRYRDVSEAIVARSMLQSAGIEVFLFDENLVRLDWQISNFLGGIRLQVDQADEEDAIELLNQPVPDEIEFGEGEDFEQPHCPVCDSREITYEGASRAAPLLGVYLVGVPLPSGRRTWRCEHCGARWEDDED